MKRFTADVKEVRQLFDDALLFPRKRGRSLKRGMGILEPSHQIERRIIETELYISDTQKLAGV